MQNPHSLSRETLNHRHRLSHQQIDDLLEENKSISYINEKLFQLHQVKEFLKLTDVFRKADIAFIPLKGPILSFRLYNDPSYRLSNDLDLLLPVNKIKKAMCILEENGYKPYNFYWPSNIIKEKLLLNFSNQILFVHPEKNIYIEIHWKLFKVEITRSNVLNEVLLYNSEKIQFKDREFKVFNAEFELLYLIIHGGLHTWFRLKWLLDVKEYIEKIPVDPDRFIRLMHKFNASRMVALCNATLSQYFPDCPLLPVGSVRGTENRLHFTKMQIENKKYYNKAFFSRIRTYFFELRCFSGYRYKVSLIGVIIYGKYLKHFEISRN